VLLEKEGNVLVGICFQELRHLLAFLDRRLVSRVRIDLEPRDYKRLGRPAPRPALLVSGEYAFMQIARRFDYRVSVASSALPFRRDERRLPCRRLAGNLLDVGQMNAGHAKRLQIAGPPAGGGVHPEK